MPHTYWENLQPFGPDDEEPAEPVDFEQLRTLYVSLQSTMQAARELAERVAVEAKLAPPEGDSAPYAP